MPALSREAILARKAGHEQVDLGDGDYVVVRALKRAEILAVKDMGDDANDRDNYIISCGLVEPALTLDEVAELAENMAAADMAKISIRIGQLSGMMEDSAKAITKRPARSRK